MRYSSVYVKMQVLGAIDAAEGKTQRERIRAVSRMTFVDEQGNAFRFSWRTIETWLVRYRKHGITGMCPKPRSDVGQRRKIEPERVQEAIEQVLPQFNNVKYNVTMIYRACVERGALLRHEIAPNTFRRIVKQYEMLKPASQVESKMRLAFSKRYANELWQADTMVGPYATNAKGVKKQTRLIAFIDDASRVICHGEFFFNDNVDAMVAALRRALIKRGVPEQIYVDNGSNYSSKELVQICARLGCLLSHTPIRDGQSKGKIERFFRTVREQFLAYQLNLDSLEELNRQFTRWVEDEYNDRVHSTIHMKPIDRFGLDLNRIRYLPPNEFTDELFYREEERKVINDNTFSFGGVRYEPPRDLRRRKIAIRFNRANANRIVVYHNGERMGEATPLDRVANDRKPQNKGEGK